LSVKILRGATDITSIAPAALKNEWFDYLDEEIT
jgi:hypothetical protein